VGSVKLRHETVTLDYGFRVGYTDVGQGIPLVFLHGLGVSARAYEELMVELAEVGFRVIGLDAVNHGRTDSMPWGHTVEDMVYVTRCALDKLKITYAIMAGHSMGGGMIVEFAARYPERVIAAVLLDAAAGAEHHEGMQMGKLHSMAPRAAQKLAGAVVDLVGDGAHAASLRDLKGWVKLTSILRSSVAGFRFIRAAYALVQADTVPLLPTLNDRKVPTAILHGELDQIVPLCAARSAAELAGADLYVVDEAFHSWMLADPRQGAELILKAVVKLLNRSDWS
jgi:pimeloyl-ACP methyl ester carboxylesterase